MDTYQLEKVLSRYLGSSFGGVYPVGLIPDLKSKEKAMVINLDPHDKPGSLWMCLYLNGNTVEYLDYDGLPPISKPIEDFMDRNGYHMTYNKNRYQDYNTNVCGLNVLNHLFPKGWKPKQTDKYVREWFNEHYRKPKTHKGQCCKTFQQNGFGWELVH